MLGVSNFRGQLQLPAEVYLALMYEQSENTLMSSTAVLGNRIWRNLNQPSWSLNLLKWEEELGAGGGGEFFVSHKVFFLFRALSVFQDLVLSDGLFCYLLNCKCLDSYWEFRNLWEGLLKTLWNPTDSLKFWIYLIVDEEDIIHSMTTWRRWYKDRVSSL